MEQQRHDRHNDGHGEEDRKQDAGGAHAREASGRLVGVCQVRRLLHELHELLEGADLPREVVDDEGADVVARGAGEELLEGAGEHLIGFILMQLSSLLP